MLSDAAFEGRPAPFVLRQRQFIRKPLHEVFAFFSMPENLRLLTPKNLGLQILTPSPIVMKEGAIIDYTITLGGFPVRWTTLIATYEPPHMFVDIQLKGPYASWHHTHTFTQSGDGTQIDDEVRYTLPFGVVGLAVHKIFVRRKLESIFSLRSDAINTIFAEEKRSVRNPERLPERQREII